MGLVVCCLRDWCFDLGGLVWHVLWFSLLIGLIIYLLCSLVFIYYYFDLFTGFDSVFSGFRWFVVMCGFWVLSYFHGRIYADRG